MDEIEKLYANAGVEMIELDYPDNFDPFYPEFTAEKQLNIIKFLGKTRDFHTCGRYCSALNSEGDSVESLQDKFEESLAGLMNMLWQDLTAKEKQQIKEIIS